MIFTEKKYKIKLSNRLGWSIRRRMSPAAKFWLFGSAALVLAGWFTLNLLVFGPKSPEPQVLGETTTEETSATPKIEFIDYTVEKGDTVFNIGQKLGVSWTAIAQLNDLGQKADIKPGQILKIPISK